MSVQLYAMTLSGEQLDQLQDFLSDVAAFAADVDLGKRAEGWLEHTKSDTKPVDD